MGLVKCPRCELNYMNDTDTMCSVCRREVRGESEQFEMIELCSECGENPVVPGQELCAYCLKEQARRNEIDSDEDVQHERRRNPDRLLAAAHRPGEDGARLGGVDGGVDVQPADQHQRQVAAHEPPVHGLAESPVE